MSATAQTVTSPMASAISLSNVTKTFQQSQKAEGKALSIKNILRPAKKTITALDDISFTIRPGEFAAYAGANGAGKSTTMKLLCGMLLPGEGEIQVLGQSPRTDRIPLMRRVGVLFGNRSELWWDHTVLQSYAWKQVVWDIPKPQYEETLEELVEALDLEDILHTFARELSLGQRMKADLAMMLLHRPDLILLDEPTIGLDVLAKRQMIDFLKALNQNQGTTIIVTSHDMDDLEEMADRILLISKGKIAFDGGFDSLRRTVGHRCRISITSKGNGYQLEGAQLISSNQYTREYEFDMNRLPVQEMLTRIAAIPNIMDLEIKKPPIEEIISGLYRQWK